MSSNSLSARMRQTKRVFAPFVSLLAMSLSATAGQIQGRSGGQAVNGLLARAVCSVQEIKAGEPVVVELWLENTSDQEIMYYDSKKEISMDWPVIVLVDYKPAVHLAILDAADSGYRVVVPPLEGVNNMPRVSPTPAPVFAIHLALFDAADSGYKATVPPLEEVNHAGPVPPKTVPVFATPPAPAHENFRVLKPGAKVAYRKADLRTAEFQYESATRPAAMPLQIPGEHIIQIEYKNQTSGRPLGLSAWSGTLLSNVLSVRVADRVAPEESRRRATELLGQLERLESEYVARFPHDAPDGSEAVLAGRRVTKSGVRWSVDSLSQEIPPKIMVLGEAAAPVLVERLRALPVEAIYQRRCIDDCLSRIGRPAVPDLVRALGGPGPQDKAADAQYRQTLIWILGKTHDPRAAEPLLNRWNKPDLASERRSLADALGVIGDPRAVEPILAALQECVAKAKQTGDWQTEYLLMYSYAEAFSHLQDMRAAGVLKEMLHAEPQTTPKGKEYHLRYAAAMALRAMRMLAQSDEKNGVYTVLEEPAPKPTIGSVRQMNFAITGEVWPIQSQLE